MHRLTFSIDEQVTTWVFPDGLFALPNEAAVELKAHAILAVAERAQLVGDYGLRELATQPGQGRSNADQIPTITWHPEARPKPLPLLPEEPTAPAAPGTDAPPLRLINSLGQEWPLGDDLTLLGRHPVCTIVVKDPGVSALHCVIHRIPAGVRILDLDSTNGTFVGGAQIQEAYATRPTSLRIGNTRFELATPTTSNSLIDLPSTAMRELDRVIKKIAPANAPVLIHGESGVGKESVAHRLHDLSGRHGRFVAINAAVITPALAGSELFGHVRGSFTGADRDRTGAFACADGGTLFLDEVAELPLEVQAELLRALEQKVIRPIGSSQDVPIDVRVVTATHCDLAARVRAGQFREDLYHRVCVIPLLVPPLRDRQQDIEALATAFVGRQPGSHQLSAAALTALKSHPWPGNVRQLLNTLRRACVMCDRALIDVHDLDLDTTLSCNHDLNELIRTTVFQAYEATGGSVAETARLLGINRSAIYRHLRERTGRPRRIRAPQSGRA